jgi:hypothetical protein
MKVVVDNGGDTIKAGFAGYSAPKWYGLFMYSVISHINKPYHLCISVVPNCTARMKSQLQQLVADETVSTVKGNGGAAGFLYQRNLF